MKKFGLLIIHNYSIYYTFRMKLSRRDALIKGLFTLRVNIHLTELFLEIKTKLKMNTSVVRKWHMN